MAMRRIHHSENLIVTPEPDPSASRVWLLTFTDLVSLMLTFFVLLFSMSNVKVDQWENIIDSLSKTLQPKPEKTIKAVSASFNIGTIYRKTAINLDYLSSVLTDTIAKVELLSDVSVVRLEDRLVISLPGDLLFQPGRAEMTVGASEAMFVLGGVLSNIGNQVGVNGHTDPSPPAGEIYSSNWELTTARAAAVANSLRKAGYAENIVAYGFSHSRYDLLPEVDENVRRSFGRRVDIVVYPNAGTE